MRVWFEARDGERSKAFTYRAAEESRNRVLILANEDYTGASPGPVRRARSTCQAHLAALRANGIRADVYDVDARGRTAPDPLGVLSHYRAVLWYTGDDIVTREKGGAPGTAAKNANDTQLAVRDFLNEGGKLLYAGKYAGFANANALRVQPQRRDAAVQPDPAVDDGCLPLSNDFLQYYLGSYVYSENTDPPVYPLTGIARPFEGLTADFAAGADHSASHLVTSSFLPKETYPQFASYDSIDYQRPGGSPFEPKTGDWYVASNQGEGAYKRLTRTIDLTGKSAADLQFAVSHDTEAGYDAVFVEAHTVGQDDWTTLPDANGHTTQTDTLRELQDRVARPAPVHGPLPDGPARRRRWRHRMYRDRHDRAVARRQRELGRLPGLEGRPVRLRRQAGRGVDLLRHRLRGRGAGRVRGRRQGHRRRRERERHLVRAGPGRMDRRSDRRRAAHHQP